MKIGRPKGVTHRRELLRKYSVYERGTDRPICIYGTAQECAAAMGISQHSFYTYVLRMRAGRAIQKYDIYIDDDEEDLEG